MTYNVFGGTLNLALSIYLYRVTDMCQMIVKLICIVSDALVVDDHKGLFPAYQSVRKRTYFNVKFKNCISAPGSPVLNTGEGLRPYVACDWVTHTQVVAYWGQWRHHGGFRGFTVPFISRASRGFAQNGRQNTSNLSERIIRYSYGTYVL